MRVLLDTNILVRIAHNNSKHRREAFDAVRTLHTRGYVLRTVPQNFYEFWVVATRPTDDNGLGLSAEAVALRLDTFQRYVPLLRDERDIFERWQQLVENYQVIGKSAHDARLVAAMLRHGIDHLLTFNAKHFVRFSEITVLTPAEVLAGS